MYIMYMSQYSRFLTMSLECSMIVKLLTEHHLEFLSLKGGCIGLSESTRVDIPHCWKSHATAHILRASWKISYYICHYLYTLNVKPSLNKAYLHTYIKYANKSI